jgi:DNA replication protein DnaC
MTSPATNPTADLCRQLTQIGLHATASGLDDFIARATTARCNARTLLDMIVRTELEERSRRSLERRLQRAKLGRFKPMADFDWNWPKKIERDVIERAFTLDFIREGRNLILVGTNGLGKTMITRNIAHQAILAGHSVLFRTAPDLIADLQIDSPQSRRRRLAHYARPQLLCIDSCAAPGYVELVENLP